jgi:hypothetical protein
MMALLGIALFAVMSLKESLALAHHPKGKHAQGKVVGRRHMAQRRPCNLTR